jgi:hypothetical protein
MDIFKHEITIRELVEGFVDNAEKGVRAYAGKLDIRPPYQREFVYGEKERAKVIETVMKNYPLNTMYWAKCKDGNFEIIDGQQRTLSICQYVNNEFSFNLRTFKSLQEDEKKKLLDYKLFVYVCDGGDKEKLDWFETINIAGKVLTPQELRNATFHGSWVTSAKFYFSKTNCAAYNIGSKYLNGEMKRQAYLETAIKWICGAKDDDGIREYMAQHVDDPDAQPLFSYFQNVIEWVKAKFPKYRKEMKGVPWGPLFKKFGQRTDLDSAKLEKLVAKYMVDSDVQKKSGIYEYVLDGDERHLDIREFDDNIKREVYEKQNGICKKCGKHFEIEQMHADHINPWSKGGRTIAENCQMLCADCNRRKSNI